MSRQHNPSTLSRHIATAYDGRGLGRDDPVWPLYVKEAGDWDGELADGWNKSMDNLLEIFTLVFAALFSAIVTAFVIESYKNLQPDPTTDSASGISDIVKLLQVIAAGQQPNSTSADVLPPDDFQPTTTAVLVNLIWFLSLSLSMTVTLISMLVKQWCTGFLSGRLAPPCVQARLRQARYDKLKSWRTEDIVLTLPLIMHVALGLFLIGLTLFLHDLNHLVFLPVLVVVILTLTFYVITTLLPLVVSFCPYTTPLSSRKLWGLFCWIFGLGGSDDSRYTPPCQRKEKRVCESTTPDSTTARALDWLICHSDSSNTVDVAIRGLAGAGLDKSVWSHLAQEPLMLLVAQRFTASFNGVLGKLNDEKDGEAYIVQSLYGRALANLASHSTEENIIVKARHSMRDRHIVVNEDLRGAWEQSEAVELGLYRLSCCSCREIAAFGISSLSTWYEFSARPSQTKSKWKDMLVNMCKIALKHGHTSNGISTDALSGLANTLPIEVSCWRRDLIKQDKAEILGALVGLLEQTPPVPMIHSGLSLALAALAMSINKYPQPPNSIVNCSNINSNEHRTTRARELTRHYLSSTTLLERDSDALMLFGLSGLADSDEILDLDNDRLNIMVTIARRLSNMSILNVSEPVILDTIILPNTFDIRSYTVDVLSRHFRTPQLKQQHLLSEDIRAKLLGSIVQKSHLWMSFGSQLSFPVMQMLGSTQNKGLQEQCLEAMEEHWFTGTSRFHWQVLFSNKIPHKLVSIVKAEAEGQLRYKAILNFDWLTQELHQYPPEKGEVASTLLSLIRDELFETLVLSIIRQAKNKGHMKLWVDAIVELRMAVELEGSTDDQHIISQLRLYGDHLDHLSPSTPNTVPFGAAIHDKPYSA